MIKILYSIPLIELFAKGLSFVAIILMTHILPVSEMGIYSVVITLVMIASVFMDGGINNKIYSSILQNNKNNLPKYYTEKLVFSFFTILLLGIYSYLFYDFWKEIVLYSLMTFFVSQIILYKTIYRANQIKKWDIITILIDPLSKLFVLSLIFLFNIEVNLNSILLLLMLISIFEYFIIYRQFTVHYSDIKFLFFTIDEFLQVLKEIKYFILFYFLYILYQRVDIFFIQNYLDLNNAAVYFSAYNIYTAIVIFITSLVSVNFPKIKDFSLKDKLLFYKKYFLLYFLFLVASYFVIPTIYTIIYPTKYAHGSEVLLWLLMTVPFVFISYLIIFSFNYLKLESQNIRPIVYIFVIKLLVYLILANYLNNIATFAKFYMLFEILLAIYFVVLYSNKRMNINE